MNRGGLHATGPGLGERGTALIEFALVLPPLLLILAIVIDLGMSYNTQLKSLRAVAAGSLYAFENGGTVTSGTANDLRATIAAVVQESTGSTLNVTVLINNVAGSSAADDYYCTAGYPISWTSTGSSQAVCADQTRSAKFVTIRTSANPDATIPIMSFGATLFPVTETITVRTK